MLALALAVAAEAAPQFSFHVLGDEPGAWPRIFSSLGMASGAEGGAHVIVIPRGDETEAGQWVERARAGAFLVLEGESETARALGFAATERRIAARSVEDVHRPGLSIVWEHPVAMKVHSVPEEAKVFARERWERSPLVAGMKLGAGGALWVAAPPGERGYERFPYLAQALAELGLEFPFRSGRLWAFFDGAYRSRVDLDYFARRWREAGISALHVAAWHHFEPDKEKDAFLRRLIAACHKNAILVYAWLELPHVSERFWEEHPEWREKTALGQDAHLDWRKLMNLINRDCFRAVERGVRRLVERFDWDGVNLAELYFESLEGHENRARFTPMNDDVRREFRALHGFDPMELFEGRRGGAEMGKFLDYRAELARRMQREWIESIEGVRRGKPHLDVVLTHVDDRFDSTMREKIGADAAGLLPLLGRHDFTFLIEDPATVWHLGAERYTEIANRYRPLTPRREKLAIDINIVERYQDVYPTKQQTGLELFQLVHLSSRAFPRVALYFENSILPVDAPLLEASAAVVERVSEAAGKLVVDSPHGVGVRWAGDVRVNGRPWPVTDGRTVWLPPGPAAVEASEAEVRTRLLRLNGELRTAAALPGGVEFSYVSAARAFAVVDRRPVRMEIDGMETAPEVAAEGGVYTVRLPRGQHLVTIETD